MQQTLSSQHKRFLSSEAQTTETTVFLSDYQALQSKNSEMVSKIESLEKNLFKSELKCIELNQMIKNCYNEVELFTEKDKKGLNSERNKHRVVSLIEKEFPNRHRSCSQEDKIEKHTPQKLSLINIINYKSKLGDHSKTPTQKHSLNTFSFPNSLNLKKKINSPVPRY